MYEKLQLDPLRLVHVRPINLVQKEWGKGFSRTEGGKAAADLEKLLMAIVWIEILQQKCDHSALF
jgi:hypothetical protein